MFLNIYDDRRASARRVVSGVSTERITGLVFGLRSMIPRKAKKLSHTTSCSISKLFLEISPMSILLTSSLLLLLFFLNGCLFLR